jgi:hypothetical protein
MSLSKDTVTSLTGIIQEKLNDVRQQKRELAEQEEKLKQQIDELYSVSIQEVEEPTADESPEPQIRVAYTPPRVGTIKWHTHKILKENPKGMTIKELSEAVLAEGYQTDSEDFPKSLYQNVYKDQMIMKTANDRYKLITPQ